MLEELVMVNANLGIFIVCIQACIRVDTGQVFLGCCQMSVRLQIQMFGCTVQSRSCGAVSVPISGRVSNNIWPFTLSPRKYRHKR